MNPVGDGGEPPNECNECGHPEHAHNPTCSYHASPRDPFDAWEPCDCAHFVEEPIYADR
jgi:hypothetical protein